MFTHRVQITPHRNLRLHVGQGVMYITQTCTQRVIFVNREAQRHVCTITLVGIVGQVGVICLEVIIEETTTEAYTIYSEVRVGYRQFSIGLVIVFGPVDTNSITCT